MFSPSAATRFGVKPNSEIRDAIVHSASASTRSALITSTTCIQSNTLRGDCGSRAEMEYRSRPRMTTRSRSNAIRSSRLNSIMRPVNVIVAR